MKICQECFADNILKVVIVEKQNRGTCDNCKSEDYVYDSVTESYLFEMYFDSFISIFSKIENIPNIKEGDGFSLKTEIIKNWNIFKSTDENKVYNMVLAICKNTPQVRELLNSMVEITKKYDKRYLKDHSLLTDTWESFVSDIKYNNRFHSNQLNKRILKKYCAAIVKPYEAGKKFFRCRISEKGVIFKPEEIGAPPEGKSSDGRANARGVSRLYLADSDKTAIHETRTGLYDTVCIGEFSLKNDIIVVDFKRINQISPFQDGIIDDIAELAINKQHLVKIDEEMGRIMRKTDDVLDYLPTQYIADFVKSIVSSESESPAYDGIEFRSVMNSKGYNLAMFHSDDFDVGNIVKKEITDISYSY
ncbi:RES family NAD+ phosphorylase [Streptococcus loxodontisalivarius]|uniref:RES domain-containing protein n=1 Tax=Streptococcus loxodontisalivarius TaxID=1349415 RepID=A0ABS2PUY2_9STRE|nr:RES family NAD+ phosphorylase [Streptococcus loxodontisalivarius]MBM7643335.1 hypothetical protein [Streptococcus loxodontisalivarius]